MLSSISASVRVRTRAYESAVSKRRTAVQRVISTRTPQDRQIGVADSIPRQMCQRRLAVVIVIVLAALTVVCFLLLYRQRLLTFEQLLVCIV
jgi:hypothetical protein